MAHNLNYNQQKGKHSFFSVKGKAWHGLGQIISDYPTSEKAIIHAGLDYQVEKDLCLPTMQTITFGTIARQYRISNYQTILQPSGQTQTRF